MGVELWGCWCLAVIAVVAVASSPMVRAFGDDPRHVNSWVLHFPYVWLPAVLVTVAIAGHIVVDPGAAGGRARDLTVARPRPYTFSVQCRPSSSPPLESVRRESDSRRRARCALRLGHTSTLGHPATRQRTLRVAGFVFTEGFQAIQRKGAETG